MTGDAEHWRVFRAGPDQAPALADLEADAFGAASWGAAAVSAGIAAPNVTVLLAAREGRAGARPAASSPPPSALPSGFALYRIVADEAEILTIGVAQSARRRGAARALIDEILRDANDARVARIFLEVAEGNAAAIALYAGAGFEAVGERRAYYKDGANAIMMARRL